MRSSLLELPVLAASLWGGLISGAASYVLRLPRRLSERALKGRRAGFALRAALFAADVSAALALAAGFAATLLISNGGEPRLYAVCGFAGGAYLSGRVLRALIWGE
ncbi:MAG: hypothetical protein IKH31_05495 [Clostridia bacterium]|jgi:hypothetical protein|nr:hypothetical protein [Oscillospiraceae bacterium]MBQ4166967.1 hypothetical protein [Clostridia bacterium]MBQ4446919.1 hypothetical protein [Clostridia bacterium]MBR3487013.1 hypothetical protein [Clostridia bacterium]